jgi:hypothetical protein
VKPSLAKVNRALARQWHPTRNAPLTPGAVTYGSNKKVWWVCKNDHEWQATVHARTRGTGCPYCSGRAVSKENCLQTRNSKLAREWHPTRNAPLTPADVAAGTQKKAWWVCAKGHAWEAEVNSRNWGAGCPYCTGNKACKDNCLQTVNPTLAREWHSTKNAPLTPRHVTAGSNEKVWWFCRKGHEWQAQINVRNRVGCGCPYCARKKACQDNCLLTDNPKLAGEWHPIKNAPFTPKDVISGSDKKFWWLCRKGHEWVAPILSRNRGSGCPYCARKRLCKDNCLQTVNPKLAREWHPTRNAPLTPKDVLVGTWQKAWWVCSKGHEWNTHIASRNMGSGCPYCAGRRASKENSLQTLNPLLAAEWHPTKNGAWSPGDVALYSQRQMWWKCKKGHEQRERVVDRYRRGGCPVCTLKARVPRLFETAQER